MREKFMRYRADRDRLEHANIRLVLSALLAENANCVDVGAYKGDILRHVVRVAPRGRHIAYEPVADLHTRLVARFPTVEVRWAAVADRPGTDAFRHVLDEPAFSSLRSVPNHVGRPVADTVVPVESLDRCLPEGYVPAVIKIDVEGAEYRVLLGAQQTIRRHGPTIIVEFARDAASAYGVDADQMFALLHDQLGMRIFDMEGNGPYRRPEFNRVFHARRLENYLIRP